MTYACTYDNPVTMMRECWQDGRLQAAYSLTSLYQVNGPMPPYLVHMGANIGPWKTGQLFGDSEALEVKDRSTK